MLHNNYRTGDTILIIISMRLVAIQNAVPSLLLLITKDSEFFRHEHYLIALSGKTRGGCTSSL